jgi:hypothetical protein
VKRLENSFILEILQPSVETSLGSIKDKSISDFPQFPGSQEKNLHKERHTSQKFSALNSSMDFTITNPADANFVPAFLGKGTIKE